MSTKLVLYLDGPLQSWGYMADHVYRNTLPHPTRSGVTGILAAALGIDRSAPDEPEQIARLNTLQMTVLGLSYGSPLRDFHTAQTLGVTGEPIGQADVTYRDYRCDARFLVLLAGDASLMDEVEAALRDPVWFGTLGRRSCVPSSPILLGRFESEAAAMDSLEEKLQRTLKVTLRVEETTTSENGALLLRDVPLGFGSRTYGQRAILVSRV